MKTSKVTEARSTGENWSNDHGLFHKWAIKFENGDAGIANVKDGFDCKFIPGQVSAYEHIVTGEKFPDKIQHKQMDGQANPYQNVAVIGQGSQPVQTVNNTTALQPQAPIKDPTRTSIERQCCIKAAADLHKETGAKAEDVIESAKKFHLWITSE